MNILVCDDNKIFAQNFCGMLRDEFLVYGERVNVHCANSGAEALQTLAQTEITVLFLDIDMPELDGFSVAEKLQSMGGGAADNLCIQSRKSGILFFCVSAVLVSEKIPSG